MSGTERVSSSDPVGLGNNAFEQLATDGDFAAPAPPPRTSTTLGVLVDVVWMESLSMNALCHCLCALVASRV